MSFHQQTALTICIVDPFGTYPLSACLLTQLYPHRCMKIRKHYLHSCRFDLYEGFFHCHQPWNHLSCANFKIILSVILENAGSDLLMPMMG